MKIHFYGRLADSIGRDIEVELPESISVADLRQRLATQGAESLGGSSEHYAAYIRSELGRWTKVVKDSGAKAD